MPTTLDLIEATVLANGRALKLVFASDEPPANLATFADRHRSQINKLVLAGSKQRSSLSFAGCSVTRGQNDAYILDTAPGASSADTNGTSLAFYQGDTLLGTIPPLANKWEKQQVALNGATGGTFTLTLAGKTTAPIAFDAEAATVQTAIGKSGITVSGDAGGPWLVSFGGTFGNTDQPLIVADGSGLTGDDPAIEITVTQEGVDAARSLTSQLKAILESIPIPDDAPTDFWTLVSPADAWGQTPAKSGDQSYKITVEGGDGQSVTTEAITYTNIQQNTDNANGAAAVAALRAALESDCVTGTCPNARPQDITLIFRRENAPFWPITAVSVTDASDPALLNADGERNVLTIRGPVSVIHGSFTFGNALGCRDLDLSMVASDPSRGIVFQRMIQGDSRYRWNAYFYLDNPAEVITFGETLTISAPAGLLAGSAPSASHPEGEATGDQTAAFADFAVTNLSWASPDGDLSGDLCWVTDEANGVDNGWGRWRSEAPPAAWVGVANPPMRIAYVDPDYDGSNGPSRLNDPTRPYTNAGPGNPQWNDWIGANGNGVKNNWDTPKLVLFKKGSTITKSPPINWPAASGTTENPVILSTYWMETDGPAPSDYATISQNRSVQDRTLIPYLGQNIIVHGLVFDCQWAVGVPLQDFAFWDCVFPPTVNSPGFTTVFETHELVQRAAMVRCTIYDRWSDDTNVFTQGVFGDCWHDMLFDQCTFLRNGFIALTDGFDGGPNSYMTKLGNDPAAMLTAPYKTVFVHDIYASSVLGTPILLFNSYGGQGVGAAYNARTGCVMYGCVRYGDSDLGVSPCGDPDSSRSSSSHIRRNLFLRSKGSACIRPGTWKAIEIVGSTVNVIEDNLILEPTRTDGGSSGIATTDLGFLTNCRAIVVRQNTLVDQGFYWSGESFNGITDSNTPPDSFQLAVARNLLIRTSDFPADNTASRMATLINLPVWSGLRTTSNLFLASGGVRAGDFIQGGTSIGYTGWQALGLDAGSVYEIQDFKPAVTRPSGGMDLLVTHLARHDSSVTDAASALSVLRDRRPGQWDEDRHAPLGTDGGILKAAETSYRPSQLDRHPDAEDALSYFGAINYLAGDEPPPSAVAVVRRPPLLLPGRIGRFGC